jgi:hypothetical protein
MTLHVAPLRSDRATSEWSVARLPTGGACTLTFDIVRGESSRGAGLQEWRSQSVPRSRAVTPRTNRGYVLGAIAATRPPRPPERAERPTVLRQVQDCKFPKVNCEARKGRCENKCWGGSPIQNQTHTKTSTCRAQAVGTAAGGSDVVTYTHVDDIHDTAVQHQAVLRSLALPAVAPSPPPPGSSALSTSSRPRPRLVGCTRVSQLSPIQPASQ